MIHFSWFSSMCHLKRAQFCKINHRLGDGHEVEIDFRSAIIRCWIQILRSRYFNPIYDFFEPHLHEYLTSEWRRWRKEENVIRFNVNVSLTFVTIHDSEIAIRFVHRFPEHISNRRTCKRGKRWRKPNVKRENVAKIAGRQAKNIYVHPNERLFLRICEFISASFWLF